MPHHLTSVMITELFILLVAAHCYGDFLLQNDWMVARKRHLPVLCLHTGIHALLVYLILQDFDNFTVPIAVFVLHTIIDRIKVALKPTAKNFIYDQLAHIISLAFIAHAAFRFDTNTPWVEMPEWDMGYRAAVIGLAGFIAVVLGPRYLIEGIAHELIDANPKLKTALGHGLKGGGALIGQLERALIFVLIAIGQPAGIGFLIAAKSILRFEEAKEQAMAEYVLIGTLWSFGLAIAISWATVYALQRNVIPVPVF